VRSPRWATTPYGGFRPMEVQFRRGRRYQLPAVGDLPPCPVQSFALPPISVLLGAIADRPT